MLNKCSNPNCKNLVVSNRYNLCPVCYKATETVDPVEYHKCATSACNRQIPEQFKLCIPCIKARRAQQEQKFENERRLRSELLTEYKSDKLRDGAVIIAEKESAHVVIGLDGVKHVFDDRDGIVAARRYAHERIIRRAYEDEFKLRTELLAEFQAEKLRDGARVTAINGSLISIAFAGKSYTLNDEQGAKRRIEEARAKEEAKLKKKAEAARRVEEERGIREAEIQRIFAQIKAGTLENAVADRSGKTISVLYDDGRVLSFDDPDALAEETRLRAAAEKKSKGKSEGKQRKAA